MNGVEILSSLLKLGVVFALLYLTLRGLAKHQGRSVRGGRSAGKRGRTERTALVEVLDQSTVGRSANVVAVRAGNRVFLLGVTETDVSTLADLTGDIELTSAAGPEDAQERVLDHALDILRSGSFRR